MPSNKQCYTQHIKTENLLFTKTFKWILQLSISIADCHKHCIAEAVSLLPKQSEHQLKFFWALHISVRTTKLL